MTGTGPTRTGSRATPGTSASSKYKKSVGKAFAQSMENSSQAAPSPRRPAAANNWFFDIRTQ